MLSIDFIVIITNQHFCLHVIAFIVFVRLNVISVLTTTDQPLGSLTDYSSPVLPLKFLLEMSDNKNENEEPTTSAADSFTKSLLVALKILK